MNGQEKTMTTATAAAPAQIDRATMLAARMLRASAQRRDRKPLTAAAFGRALAATQPGSAHGKVLAAALRSADWHARPREERIVLGLARSGETPTAAALAARLGQLAAKRDRLRRARDRARAIADRDGQAASACVARVVAETGAGPTWGELAAFCGWPRDKGLRQMVIRELAAAGWVTTGQAPRSLRPGPER